MAPALGWRTGVHAADPADVGSVNAIIHALYASISGPKDAPRDFDRLRTLFAPNARLIWTGVAPDGTARLRNFSVEEYITAAGPGLMANGFFEQEIGRTSDSFGNVTHVMSAYDSRNTLEDPKPFARGTRSRRAFCFRRGDGFWLDDPARCRRRDVAGVRRA